MGAVERAIVSLSLVDQASAGVDRLDVKLAEIERAAGSAEQASKRADAAADASSRAAKSALSAAQAAESRQAKVGDAARKAFSRIRETELPDEEGFSASELPRSKRALLHHLGEAVGLVGLPLLLGHKVFEYARDVQAEVAEQQKFVEEMSKKLVEKAKEEAQKAIDQDIEKLLQREAHSAQIAAQLGGIKRLF